MAERMNFAAWSGVLATWVSIAGALGGGYLALQTYNEEVAKMEDARVVQTFALFEMFNSSETLQSRQRVLDAANGRAPSYEGRDMWLTLDFYDALQVCIERNLCDQDLSVRLFQPYAVPIWQGLGDEIVGGRTESDPNMGAGLQWLASLPRPGVVGAETAVEPAAEEEAEPEADAQHAE